MYYGEKSQLKLPQGTRPQPDLFISRLDNMLNRRHFLYRLAHKIDWGFSRRSSVPSMSRRWAAPLTVLEDSLPFRVSTELLTTIPVVRDAVARVIIAGIGLDLRRFPTPRHMISWVGLCPGINQNDGKLKNHVPHRGLDVICSNSNSTHPSSWENL